MLVPLLLAPLACNGSEPLGPDDHYLVAEATGAFEASYTGAAKFRWLNSRQVAYVFSWPRDRGAINAVRFHKLAAMTLDDGRVVELRDIPRGGARVEGIRVQVSRDEDAYWASSGWIEAEEVTEDVIRASFSFTAYRYCHESPGGCPQPREAPTSEPSIDVTGHFYATLQPPPTPLDHGS